VAAVGTVVDRGAFWSEIEPYLLCGGLVMIRRLLTVGVLLLAGVGSALAQATSQLVGTWNLVSYRFAKSDGTATVPMGTDPVGRLIYDARGGMFIEIMRKERPRSTAAVPPQVTPEEAKSAFDGYIAYFGTYALNETEHTVTHRVEASLFPNWSGQNKSAHTALPTRGFG
jgi:Lipocalin-like domain